MLKLRGIAFRKSPVRRRAPVAAAQRHRHDDPRALLHAAPLTEQPDAEGRIGNPVRANTLRNDRQPLRLALGGADFMAAFDHQIPHRRKPLRRHHRNGGFRRLGGKRYLWKIRGKRHTRLFARRERVRGLGLGLGQRRHGLIDIDRRRIAQRHAPAQRGQLLFQPAHRIEVVAIQRTGNQPIVPIAGEQQSRLMPGILHPVFRDLYAQSAGLAIERRLARQTERTGDRGVELVVAAFPVHAAANIAAGNGNFMGSLRQHVAVGTGCVHPCPRGRYGRMIVQRFGNLFARRQIGALGQNRGGREQRDKRP